MTAVLGAVLLGVVGGVLIVGLGVWFVEKTRRARFRNQYLARSRSRYR